MFETEVDGSPRPCEHPLHWFHRVAAWARDEVWEAYHGAAGEFDAALDLALRHARAEGAVEALTMMPCSMNWEDERVCTFADISLEDACPRCWRKAEAQAELRAIEEEIDAYS